MFYNLEIDTCGKETGTNHTISVTRFLEHDHKHNSVYYADYPLTPKDEIEEKSNMVITILGFGFSTSYTATLAPYKQWNFYRCPVGKLAIERVSESEEIVIRFTPKI